MPERAFPCKSNNYWEYGDAVKHNLGLIDKETTYVDFVERYLGLTDTETTYVDFVEHNRGLTDTETKTHIQLFSQQLMVKEGAPRC